jgi:hypothetical protein
MTQPLDTLAVVTCERPEALRRCLTSHARHARAVGRSIEPIVLSDTRTKAGRQLERTMLAQLARELEVPIRYAGSEEKQRLAKRLARKLGCDRALVDFAIRGPAGVMRTAGANRNAALLETCGRKVWMVDDDTVCRPAELPERRDGVSLRPVYDPTEVRLCASRSEAMDGVVQVNDDLFAAHESTLGRQASAFFSEEDTVHDGEQPPPASVCDGTVVLSSLGIYGDGGARSSGFFCYRDDATRAALCESEARHAELASSREIVRGVRRLTLTLGGFCQTTSVALDNGEPLVPFLPVGRGQDLLFGSMLRVDRPKAWFAYQPQAILHAPWEARIGDAPVPGRAQPQPGIAVLAAAILDAFVAKRQRSKGLSGFARDLRQLAIMPPAEFHQLAARMLCRSIDRRIVALTKQLDANPTAPEFWAQRLRLHIESWNLRCEALRSGCTLRLEGMPAGIADADVGPWAQRLLLCFADVLQLWPALCEAAACLSAGGESVLETESAMVT